MKNNFKLSFLLFLVLFVFTGCAANNDQVSVISSSTMDISGQPDKEDSNPLKEIGIKLTIPESWMVQELVGNKNSFKIDPSAGGGNFSIYVSRLADNGDLDIFSVLADSKDTSASWAKKFPYRETMINGSAAVIFDEIDEYKDAPIDQQANAKKRKEILIRSDKGVYGFSYVYKEHDTEVEDVFNKIVDSVVFLD